MEDSRERTWTMKRYIALGLVVAGLLGSGEALADKNKHGSTVTMKMPAMQQDLRAAMRKLWEDHVTYTRNFIISALAGLEDTPKITERLLRNQDDIGDAIKPYYGEKAGKKLAGLLREHILIAADIVK